MNESYKPAIILTLFTLEGVENNDYLPVKFFIILVVPFTFDLSISMVMG